MGVTYSLNTIKTLLATDQQISFYSCSTVNHLVDQLQRLHSVMEQIFFESEHLCSDKRGYTVLCIHGPWILNIYEISTTMRLP